MEHSELVAEAIAVVIAQVPADKRESVTAILSSVAQAQYSLGYRDGLASAVDMVASA